MKTPLILLFIALWSIQSTAQDNNKIETIASIELLNDDLTVIEEDTLALNSIHKKVNQLLKEKKLKEDVFPSITLIVNPSVSENSIENIKYQIRSTPVQLINLQRKTITTYDGIEVTQNVLDQYNALIKYWNSLEPEKRFYREDDLKFVESVATNMSMNQRIRNEKLPGYLPFVKPEPKFTPFSELDFDPETSYLFVTKTDTLSKDEALKNFKNRSFVLKRRIVDEEQTIIIELK